MTLAQDILATFEGSRVAHGTTHVGRIGRNGKADADSRIVREPLTEEKIQAHLDGKNGVGAIPINDTNQCRWGALPSNCKLQTLQLMDVLWLFF